jgi:hypothetical protein
MRIEQPHTLGQEAAKARIDHFLEKLVQNPPGGVTVKEAQREWNGNQMTFSFTAAKGFLGTSVRGVMDVLDDRIIVESELPSLVKNLLGEDRIRHVIAEQLGSMLRP